MQIDTMYSEHERVVTLNQLNNFNLNPFAFFGMIETYVTELMPLPVRSKFEYFGKEIELTIVSAGNHSLKYRGNIDKLDQVFLSLFLQSYAKNMSPIAVDFVFADAIGIHLRTPDANNKQKNPMRNVKSWLAK